MLDVDRPARLLDFGTSHYLWCGWPTLHNRSRGKIDFMDRARDNVASIANTEPEFYAAAPCSHAAQTVTQTDWRCLHSCKHLETPGLRTIHLMQLTSYNCSVFALYHIITRSLRVTCSAGLRSRRRAGHQTHFGVFTQTIRSLRTDTHCKQPVGCY